MEWVIAGLWVLLAAYLLWENWPRSKDAEFQKRYDQWRLDRLARGATGEQLVDEYQYRHAFARIRRKASDAVLADPGNPRQAILSAIADEASGLKAISPRLARNLAKQVGAAPLEDVLYDDAIKAISKPTLRVHRASDDDIGAVTTL